MTAITLHDAFIGAGCDAQAEPRSAVTVEADPDQRNLMSDAEVKT